MTVQKEIADYYYGMIYTASDITDDDRKRTMATIGYLIDCGYSYLDICKEISNYNVPAITYNSLRNKLWENSLIKKDAFYLHRELTIISKAPEYDMISEKEIVYPFFYEVKICYTIEDVVRYFYRKVKSDNLVLTEQKLDIGVVKYLMKKYSRLDYIEALDIILSLIDRHLTDFPDCYRMIEITKSEKEVVDELLQNMQQLEFQNRRKMVFRDV